MPPSETSARPEANDTQLQHYRDSLQLLSPDTVEARLLTRMIAILERTEPAAKPAIDAPSE